MTEWTKEQKEAIRESGKNIIVSAGAGSGKTAVLTERVVEKIKNGSSLSRLLILTFTNMAAKEMRERIGKKLEENGLLEELEKLDTADITTFDAYALSLVKKYHYYLDVSPNATIIDASVISLYRKKVLENIFEEMYQKEDESFLSLIDTYSIKDDKIIFDYVITLNNKLDLKPNKREYLERFIRDNYNSQVIEKNYDTYFQSIKDIINKIEWYLEYIDDASFQDEMIKVLTPLLNSKDYDEIKNNLDVNLPRLSKSLSDVTKEYKNKIADLIGELKKLMPYKNKEEVFDGIYKTKSYVEKIISIVLELDSLALEYKKKYDAYEYHDIANLAIKLVSEHPEITIEIKQNLDEILIDEYQDTNDIQEKFISYIASNNVYMVGDIKQSIYRFRNANPYIFKEKYDRYSKNDNGIKIDLNKNFRSRFEVIDSVNLIFNHIMDDLIGGADYVSNHQMSFGNTLYEEQNNNQNNYLEIYNYFNDTNYKKEEVEAFIVSDDINKKIKDGYIVLDKDTKKNRRITYSDIVLLIDSRKNFDLYKKILEYKGIPVTLVKTDNMVDSEIIMIMKNIINFIIKVKDNIFDVDFKKLFISLNRSFLFSLDDDKIFSYFLDKNYMESDLYQITKQISSEIDNLSLLELIELIIDKYNIYEKLFLVGDYDLNILRLDKLKEITSSLVNLDYSVYDYQVYLNDIFDNNLKIEYDVNDTDGNTVKIMTIHASKGLEFSICYYMGLYGEFNIRDASNKYTYDENYGIIFPYQDGYIKNTFYHYLSYRNYVRENIGERLRLFYVALTRAKEKMIVLLPQKKSDNILSFSSLVPFDVRAKYNSFASIMYSVESLTKKYYKNISLDNLGLTRNYNLLRNNNYLKEIKPCHETIDVQELVLEDSKVQQKSFSKDSIHLIDSEEQRKLDYGTKVHELFELTDFVNPNYDLLSNSEGKLIKNFLNKIDVNSCHIYKEYEFIYEEDNTMYHGIIDLMLEYDDSIKIIDYKLKNTDDPAYIKQLNGYKNYIEKEFKKPVSIYLYSILTDNFQKLEENE